MDLKSSNGFPDINSDSIFTFTYSVHSPATRLSFTAANHRRRARPCREVEREANCVESSTTRTRGLEDSSTLLGRWFFVSTPFICSDLSTLRWSPNASYLTRVPSTAHGLIPRSTLSEHLPRVKKRKRKANLKKRRKRRTANRTCQCGIHATRHACRVVPNL